MKILRVLFLVLLSSLSFLISNAQNVRIFGKVADGVGQPIPFATVYINGTSYGTSTNENGFFQLQIPARGEKVELITSLVGYETKKTTVFLNGEQEIELDIELAGIVLEEAVVQAKMDRFWRKKWRIFTNGLLGDVSTARNYEFTDRENIALTYDDQDKYVLAMSKEPFTIVNKTLGYNIKVDLQYFKSDGIFTQFSAYKYFEENLSPDERIREQQLEDRRKAYYRTIRHFLVSLKNGKLEENKYDVFRINKMNQIFLGRTTLLAEKKAGRLIPVASKDIYGYDSNQNVHFLHSDQSLLIFNRNYASYQGNPFGDYFYEFSRIDLPNFLLQFNETGYITKPNGLMLSYHWGKEGLGRQLPENYTPDEYLESEQPTFSQPIKGIDIAPIVAKQMAIDSVVIQNPAILDQTLTFNRIEEEDNEPDYFYEPDVSYKLAKRDGNQPIWQILKRVPSLRVIMNKDTGEYDIFLQGSNSSLMSDGGDKTPNLVINNRVYRTRQEVMDQLLAIDTRQVKEIGLIKYGGGAIFGATGGHGTIVVLMDNYKDVH